MVTEYDVFAELMEKKIKIAQLAEKLSQNYANIYARIESLRNEKLMLPTLKGGDSYVGEIG